MHASTRYHPFSIGLHWLMAALIAALVACGFVMDDLSQGALKFAAFNTHKLIGALALVLVAVRLARRAGHPPPPSGDMPAWQGHAARATYAAMVAMPVSGLLFTNFGKGVRIFGFALAPIGGANEALSHMFKETREAIAIVLIALVAAHALAALWHHFGRHDARPPACCRRARGD